MALSDSIKKAINRKLPAVDLEDSLETALKAMADNETSALVVKLRDVLVGIITDMDIIRSIANKDDLQKTMVSSFMSACELISDKSVATPCVQLDEDQDVLSALQIMDEAGVHHLLVSNGGEEPVGMVSILDLLKLASS